MFSSHNNIPQITQQQYIHKLTSMSLLHEKVHAQKLKDVPLQHEAHYFDVQKKSSVTYCAYSQYRSTQHRDTDDKQKENTFKKSRQHNDVDRDVETCSTVCTTKDNVTSLLEDTIVTQNDLCMSDTSDLLQEHDINRVRCALLEGRINQQNGIQEAILTLCVRNLSVRNGNFEQEVLEAMKDFVFRGEINLVVNRPVIANVLPNIIAKQRIYSQVHTSMFVNSHLNVKLNLQIHNDGRLEYIHMCRVHDDCNDGTFVFLCRQNYMLETWFGHIPQINYHCLYDSLDALFAVIYANIDIRLVILCKDYATQVLGNIFYSMHFAAYIKDISIRRGVDDHTGEIHHLIMSMPISDIVCSNNTKDVVITELAHMSVLMDIHRKFVDVGDTFAYTFAYNLTTDILNLWDHRNKLMPEDADKYDAIKYGIIPVIQDTLPYDYKLHTDKFIVPRHMHERIVGTQDITKYMQDILVNGTCEMCTWGYALACLHAATKLSLVDCKQKTHILLTLKTLVTKIDARFAHFSGIKVNVCDRMMQCKLQEISGQAMPLFCMVMCNVFSLAQALHNVTTHHNEQHTEQSITLNIEQLIRINLDEYKAFIVQHTV